MVQLSFFRKGSGNLREIAAEVLVFLRNRKYFSSYFLRFSITEQIFLAS